ncbi:MAG: GNAT family N-acetyltransferase [Bacteroidales bacterium]|jgi:hypothetical protein|nr:GNAT family N-acetyltransferase [Bacteroidales bacterium]
MEYLTGKVELDDVAIGKTCSLLQKAFPKATKFTPDFLKWQYVENPLGKCIGYNAFDGEKMISHYIGLPIEMNLFGSQCKGILPINVATDPQYGGKRLFSTLAAKTYALAAEEGYDFVIGVANAQTTNAYIKHLGLYLIAPLDVRIGFGTKIYDNPQNFNCYRRWTSETLEWRMRNPDNHYAFSNNILTSRIAKVCQTVSYCSQKPNNVCNKKHFSLLNLYVGLGADLKKGTYFQMPSFVKHSPFNLVFMDLKGSLPIIKKEDMFFRLIDFDVI